MNAALKSGLRVGMLTTSYPAHAGDTAGIFVEGFAQTLVASGHRVRVVAPALLHQTREGAAHVNAGLSVERLRYAYPRGLQRTFHRAGAPENLRQDPLAALGAVTYPLVLAGYLAARQHEFDVLVSHWAVPSGFVATSAPTLGRLLRPRARRVVITHGADIHFLERMPLGAQVARRIAHGSDAITFVSVGHRRRFEALVGTPLPHASVLAMGVPDAAPGATDPSREALRASLRDSWGVRGRVVLTLGRLVPIKGLDVLVEALRRVPDVTLVVAGEGPDSAALAQQAEQAGVRAVFPGVVLGDAKRVWLRAADVFVLPSRRLASGREEGTPTALLEAMLAGLPVVATDTGGVGELLRGDGLATPGGALGGERGLLVPPDDAAALRRAILDVLEHPQPTEARTRRAHTAAQAQTWERLGGRLDALVRGA